MTRGQHLEVPAVPTVDEAEWIRGDRDAPQRAFAGPSVVLCLDVTLRSERLGEPGAKTRQETPANPHFRTVAQDRDVVAVRILAEFAHDVDVHNRRAVSADEASRVEGRLERSEQRPVQVRGGIARVNRHIHPFGFDPRDLVHRQQPDAAGRD